MNIYIRIYMNTKWLDDYVKLPISFTLTEYHNKEYLKKCLESPVLVQSTRTQLTEFVEQLPDNGKNFVKYTRSKKFGRWHPETYCSTRMWRALRSGSLPSTYTDIDAVTCFPSALVAICQIHGFSKNEYNHIERYSIDKSSYIGALHIADSQVAKYNSIVSDCVSKEDLGKLIFNMQCYGAGSKAWREIGFVNGKGNGVSPFPKSGIAYEFKKQWNKLKEKLSAMDEYAPIVLQAKLNADKKDKHYHDGCALSLILQCFEALNIYNLMQHFGDCIRTYEYDGIIVELPPNDVNAILGQIHDIQLNFKIKERSPTLDMIEDQIQTAAVHSPLAIDEKERGDVIEWTTDTDAAEAILDKYKSTFIIIDGEIYTRCGNFFEKSIVKDSECYVNQFISKLDMVCLSGDENKHRNVNGLRSIVRRLRDMLLADKKYHRVITEICGQFIGKICFRNCILDLATGKTSEYADSNIVIQYVNKDYTGETSEDTQCKLNKIFECLDEPHRDYFLHLLARGFGGHYEDKRWIILHGDRNSGKGLIQEVCKLLDSYVSFINTPMLSTESDQARVLGTYMGAGCNMHGVAFSNELGVTTNSKPKLDGNVIKKLCSGGDQTQARMLHENAKSFIFTKTMILCLNNLPTVEPWDTMQTCHFFSMPYIYEGDDDEILKLASNRKVRDPTLKGWVTKTPDVLDAFVNLLIKNYKYTGAIPSTSGAGCIDRKDKSSILQNVFTLDPEGEVEKDYVQRAFHECIKDNRALSKWLGKFGITPIERKERTNPNSNEPAKYRKTKVYKGIKKNPDYCQDEEENTDLDPNTLIIHCQDEKD